MKLIVYPYHDWRKYNKEGLRGRDLHLIKRISNDSQTDRVLIINRPISLAEIIMNKGRILYTEGKKIEGGLLYQLTLVDEKIYVLDFIVFDLFRPVYLKREWWSTVYTKKYIETTIKEVSEKYFNGAITISFNPFAFKIIQAMRPQKLVYDIFDDFSDHPRLKENEKIVAKNGMNYLINKADKLILVSDHLKKLLKLSEGKLISNGFPEEFLLNKNNEEITDTLQSNVNCTIGYSGRISKRLDVELIKKMVYRFPNASFVFLGEIYDEEWIRDLKSFNNVEFVGKVKNEELPNYFKQFNLGIVPHIVDKFEVAGNSIKVFEYLSCGLPVVSTNIGEIKSENGVIAVTKNHDEFIANMEMYMNDPLNNSFRAQEKRKEYVKMHTWENKSLQFIDYIKPLNEKGVLK